MALSKGKSPTPIEAESRKIKQQEKGNFPSCHPLRAGQRVYLETPSGDEAVAIILEASSGLILLKIPAAPASSSVQNGEEILVKYWEKGFVYCWEARVVEVPGSAKDDTLKVELEKNGLTVQRRKALRVRLTVDFSFLVTDAHKGDLRGERQNCKTRNVSTTGLKFETDLPLSSGDKLAITLELPHSQKVNAYAWVVRSDSLKGDPKRRLVAVEFLQLEEVDQQTLFRFIGGVVSQQD